MDKIKRIILSTILVITFIFREGQGSRAAYGLPLQASSPQSYQEPSQSTNIYLPVVVQRFPTSRVYGVELHNIANSRILSPLMQAGLYWVRRNGVLWNLVEPTKGTRDWSGSYGQWIYKRMRLLYQVCPWLSGIT